MRSMMLGFANRHDDALLEAKRSVELSAESYFARYTLMRAEASCGHFTTAIALAPPLLSMSGRHPWALGMLGWSLAQAGQRERATAVFEEMEARSRHEFIAPLWLATTAAAIGRDDLARRFAVQAVSERDPILPIARFQPQFDGVRAIPEIRAHYARLFGES
jgi:Flp pilus assembly protein TadD